MCEASHRSPALHVIPPPTSNSPAECCCELERGGNRCKPVLVLPAPAARQVPACSPGRHHFPTPAPEPPLGVPALGSPQHRPPIVRPWAGQAFSVWNENHFAFLHAAAQLHFLKIPAAFLTLTPNMFWVGAGWGVSLKEEILFADIDIQKGLQNSEIFVKCTKKVTSMILDKGEPFFLKSF